MERRVEGRLKSWNEERGFGFVAVDDSEPIFVHISEFPRGGPAPIIDEPLSFEVTLRADGKKRAVKLLRHSVRRTPAPRAAAKPARGRSRRGGWDRIVAVGIVLSAVVLIYRQNYPTATTIPADDNIPASALAAAQRPTPAFERRCDGRTQCGQMRSCEEARFFLQHCPGVAMDGDGDGMPCESQWCN